MKNRLLVFLVAIVLGSAATMASAHHSFAAYDMSKNIEFVGVVDSVKFRNPHIEMTLKHKTADGKTEIIHFVEGAPANMLVRMGLKPSMLKPGTKITAIGAPRKDEPDKYFLKTVILADGQKFQSLK